MPPLSVSETLVNKHNLLIIITTNSQMCKVETMANINNTAFFMLTRNHANGVKQGVVQ